VGFNWERRDFESICPQAREYSFDLEKDQYFEANPFTVKKSLPLIEIQRMWIVFRKGTRPLRNRNKALEAQIKDNQELETVLFKMIERAYSIVLDGRLAIMGDKDESWFMSRAVDFLN